MPKSHLKLVTPTSVKRTVMPKRPRNGEIRSREYLTEAEVERLIKAASGNRHGHRDATMILLAYRHGLRVSELVELRCGTRWRSGRPPCMSVGRNRGRLARTRSSATSYGRYGDSSASRSPSRRSSSHQNGAHRSPRPASPHDRTGGDRGEVPLQVTSSHAPACLRLCAG